MEENPKKTDYSKASENAPKNETPDATRDDPKPVAKGRVVSARRSFFKEFFVTDVREIANHIIFDIVEPAVKDLVYGMSEGAINMLLFGNEGRRRSRGRSDRDRYYGTSYDRYYEDRSRTREDRYRARSSSRMGLVNEAEFDSESEARAVIGHLLDDLDRYPFVTVSDFCIYADIPTDRNYTLRNYGWTDLRGWDIHPVRGGAWLLSLPQPRIIDKR